MLGYPLVSGHSSGVLQVALIRCRPDSEEAGGRPHAKGGAAGSHLQIGGSGGPSLDNFPPSSRAHVEGAAGQGHAVRGPRGGAEQLGRRRFDGPSSRPPAERVLPARRVSLVSLRGQHAPRVRPGGAAQLGARGEQARGPHGLPVRTDARRLAAAASAELARRIRRRDAHSGVRGGDVRGEGGPIRPVRTGGLLLRAPPVGVRRIRRVRRRARARAVQPGRPPRAQRQRRAAQAIRVGRNALRRDVVRRGRAASLCARPVRSLVHEAHVCVCVCV